MSLDYEKLGKEFDKFISWNGRRAHFLRWLKKNEEFDRRVMNGEDPKKVAKELKIKLAHPL